MQDLTQELIVDVQDSLGLLKLNRPDKLNCLNSSLISSLNHILEEWKTDGRVQKVVLSGKGKAFCAGGDVVALIQAHRQGRSDGHKFFEREYEVDLKIARYPKPFIVLGHGPVMGGGIGLFQGAGERILDPNAVLAMPEITIGLFPDVGATYFLNQLPSFWGFLLALTGMRLSASVALSLGLADGLISKELWPQAIDRLKDQAELKEQYEPLDPLAREFVVTVEGELAQLFPWPGLEAFDQLARTYKGFAPLEQAFKTYCHGSPTSAAVIERQLLRGQELTLEEAYEKEAQMARAFLQHHDFHEGVRALLIDKDHAPKWKPSSLKEICQEHITHHFSLRSP
jgi:enoyl-CoA hydratase/carnithine racemase